MKIFALMLTLILANSAQASSAFEQLKSIKPANPDCRQIEAKIEGLLLKKGKEDETTVPIDKFSKAIDLLTEIKSPAEKDLQIIPLAFRENTFIENPEATVLAYIPLGVSDCTMARYRLTRAILSSLNEKSLKGDDRKRAQDQVRLSFSQPRYPTLIAASVNGALIQWGLENGVWTLEKTDLKAFEESRAALKTYTQIAQPKFDEVLRLLDEHKESPARLRKNARFQELRGVLSEEIQKSNDYLGQFKKLAGRLVYKKNW